MSYWNAESALQEEYQKRIKRRRNLYTIIQALCIITSTALVVYPWAVWEIWMDPPYSEAITRHVNEALRNYEHPELVKTYVGLARDGIAELGLEPTDNSALFHNRASRDVAQQYVIFDRIIKRCDDIIQWREENLVNFDFDLYITYIEKLDDLYAYMNSFEDLSFTEFDWIVLGAYLNKADYPFLYRMPLFQLVWVALSVYVIYRIRDKRSDIPDIVAEQIRREHNVRIRT